MKKRYLNNKGVSLIELVAGLPLTIILFTTMILTMMHFVRTYQETRLYLQLQEDLYQTIETMRYGYAKEPETKDDGLIGLMTAQKVIMSSPSVLEIRPLLTNLTYTESYKAFFRINDDRHITYEGYSGLADRIGPLVIFPSTPPKKIGRQWQFKILNHQDVWRVYYDPAGNPVRVRIRLEGQVRFRERSAGQFVEEDMRRNTRTCVFETYVFLDNATL